jgi:DNA-binding response OmpR family regulator
MVNTPKILVIDDDTQVCGFLAELLEARGFAAFTAHDGPEGVRRAKEVRPQVVLLDYMLPGLSGIQVLKEIRSLDPGIGVIMVTGFEISELMDETFKAGAHDYITKPIDMVYFDSVVMEMICDLLASSAARPASCNHGAPLGSPGS